MKIITGWVVQRGRIRTVFSEESAALVWRRACLGSVIREVWREQ
jgi:hypothetical protein